MIKSTVRAVFLMAWLTAEAQGLWLDVPFVKQVKNACGSACISMIIQYWNRAAHRPIGTNEDEPDIRRSLYSARAGGISTDDMASFFRARGFQTFSYSGDWDDLQQHLSKGRPLVVCLKNAPANFHYVVVAGIDRDEGVVLVNDPGRRKLLTLRRGDFNRDWHGSNNWTLLAVP